MPGAVSLTGAEYLTAVGSFNQGCEMNLANPQAVTLALNINSVAVTLTAQQVKLFSFFVMCIFLFVVYYSLLYV